MTSTLRKNRDFKVALVSRTASRFGDELALVALTLRLQASGSHPWQIAVLLAAGLVPFVLLSKVVGHVVDSVDSRRILFWSTLLQAGACLPLVFAHRFIFVVALAALVSAGGSFSTTAWAVLIPRVVGEEQIGRATSISQSAFTIGSIGAPAAAGLLSGLFGTGLPLAIDAASFTVMTVAALMIETRRHIVESDDKSLDLSGWSILRKDTMLGTLVAGLAAFVLLGMMINVVQVFLVREVLHASATWYGCTEAVWLLGIVAGSALAAKFSGDSSRAHATVIGAGMMSFVFLTYAVAPSVAWLLPTGFIGGIGNGVVNVCVATLIITRTDDQLRGRVMAALSASINTASVLSLAIGGALASLIGTREVYVVAGVCCLAVTFLLVTTSAEWRHAGSD